MARTPEEEPLSQEPTTELMDLARRAMPVPSYLPVIAEAERESIIHRILNQPETIDPLLHSWYYYECTVKRLAVLLQEDSWSATTLRRILDSLKQEPDSQSS